MPPGTGSEKRPPLRRALLSGALPAGRAVLALLALLLVLAAPGLAVSCQLWPGRSQGEGAAGTLASPPFAELEATPAASELPGQLVLYFLDVGQGDACYVRAPGGKVIVIDTGEAPGTVAGFLAQKQVERVDVLVLTHPHADHIGGALAILEGFEVGTLCDSGFPHATSTYEAVLAKALELRNQGRLTYATPRAGDNLDWGAELTVQVLHPGPALGNEANEASLVLRLVYGSFSVLFTGDVGKVSEEAVLSAGRDVASTVLKVAHHGSAGSSEGPFVNAVSPQVAVISVGRDNPFGHPSGTVLDRLAAAEASVYLTSEDGTIIVHSDGQAWGVTTGR